MISRDTVYETNMNIACYIVTCKPLESNFVTKLFLSAIDNDSVILVCDVCLLCNLLPYLLINVCLAFVQGFYVS
jgi:hypothetical protein